MASPIYTMRALANPGPGYVTWQHGYPDFLGVYAPSPIIAGSAVIVSGPVPLEQIGKLDTTYSPVGLWLFDGDLTDDSGNGFTLSGTASYTSVPRDNQKGLCYRSTLTRGVKDAPLSLMGAVTIELTGTLLSSTANQCFFCFGKSGEVEADNHAYIGMVTQNRAMFLFWESGAGVDRQVTSPDGVVPIGIPSHLVWTRDGSDPAEVNLYVNGVNVHTGSDVAATGGTAATCALRVGTDSVGRYPILEGSVLTSLKIIDGELTPAQVMDEYNRVLGGRGIVYPRL